MIFALLMALLAWLLALFLPWWSAFIPGLIIGAIFGRSAPHAFSRGFLGIALLWLIQTLLVHIGNDGIMTARIADLFSLPAGWLVMVVTVLMGGLIGGLTAWTGYAILAVSKK